MSRIAVATALAAAMLASLTLGFGIGRWTETAAPATTPEATLTLNDQGLPSRYAPTVAGARAAAVNAVIGGLALRQSSGSGALKSLGVSGEEWSAPLRLLLNADLTVCTNLDHGQVCSPDDNPQRAIYDFAPKPAAAGWITGSYVMVEPPTTVNADATAASSVVEWLQSRTKDGTTLAWLGTQFQVSMVRQNNDWKLADVVAIADPRLVAKPLSPWLTVIGFIGQDRAS